MNVDISVNKTPLDQEHRSLGAKMVPFGGWDMPLQYEGILQEYTYNRKAVSIFDCSHMGEFRIRGHYQKSGLDRIVTQRLSDMPTGTCRYGMALNSNGGVIDDLIVYRISDEEWMIVVNAANTDKNRAHFEKELTANADFEDISSKTAKLDLQGPQSRDVLVQLVPGMSRLEYYTFDYFDLLGQRVIISRTGYTGELGYEIYFPWDRAKDLWNALLKHDTVKPTGLGVRDVLRIEMCYPLYGHELTEDINPIEAGLKKFIDFEKDFIGKEALAEIESRGVEKKLVCVTSASRRSPRMGHRIFSNEGEDVGEVVSGTFSPYLQAGIGMAFVNRDQISMGDEVAFGDDKGKVTARVTKRPFYTEGSLKS